MIGNPSPLERADRVLSRLASHLPAPLNDPRVRTRLQAGAAIALGVGFFVYLLLFTNLLAPLNRLATDLLYHPAPAQPGIVIIAIDRKSVDEIGSWPWPRAIHAALLDRLQAAPPRVIAFDILFAQPSPDDGAFAAALSRTPNVLLAVSGVEAAAFPPQAGSLPAYDVVVLPDAVLRDSTRRFGHRMVAPDPDGVVRHIPTGIESDRVRYPALGLAAAQIALGASEIRTQLGGRQVIVGDVVIPVDEQGNTLLNFASPTAGITTYSYVDVFRGTVPPAAFQDKLVFIGGTSTIEAEDYAIPLQLGQARTYNVNLQADLANMLIARPPLTLQAQGALGQLALTLVIALLAGLILPHFRPLYAVALTLGFLVALLLIAFEAFNQGRVIEILHPALALVLTSASIMAFRYLFEERRRQFLTSLFRRYVPAESVGRVVDAIDRGELPLSGTRRMVTVLYADLRGFGALSTDMTPAAVLELVNQYLELALHAIQAEGGTISKPMGDALIAIWNAPLDQPDHAARGLRAAVLIRQNIARLQQKRTDQASLAFGIGLATGWAVLGNIAALGKVEYTLVGDTVNVASRISAFANNNQVLSDTATAQAPADGIVVRELSPVRVRGRKEPLPVWEIRGEETPEPSSPEEE